jgi:hypothetical protein
VWKVRFLTGRRVDLAFRAIHKNLLFAVSLVLLGCQPTGAQLISKVLSTGDARSMSAGLEQRKQGLSGDSGPAETATVIMPNGGTWFRFQSPFAITEADLRNAVEFERDLAFNPAGLLKGDSGPVTHRPALVDSTGAAVTVPFLDLSPVSHPRETAVVRESYVASVSTRAPSGGNHDFEVRLELYTLASTENQGIYAASLTTLATPGTRFGPPELQKVSFLETLADGSFDFQAWNREAMISSFRRGTQVGDVSTANPSCGTGQMRTID